VIATLVLDPGDLLLAALLLLANAAVSAWLQLGLARRLCWSALRAVLQLSVLGLVLGWVFRIGQPAPILGLMLAMCLLAGCEAVWRTKHRVAGIYSASIGMMLASSMAITLYGTSAVIGVDPWWEPRYLIPILGMLLGNTLNGISLGLETALAGFRDEKKRIEVLLAHGATPREASRDVVRRAVRTGMIPIHNAMAAAGLISIPGMMTGQILAGADPWTAARYQIFILFCIAAGVAVGTVGVVLLVTRLVFDERDRLRVDRIRPAGR